MTAHKFLALIEKIKNKAQVALPFDPNVVWGMKEQHHVTGSIQGIVYRGTVLFEEGRYFVSIGPAWLRDAHLTAGAEVEVSLEPEGPHLGNIAKDIATALLAAPDARAFFEALPTFYRKNYMRWIDDAKQTRTREARINELIRLLAAGQRER